MGSLSLAVILRQLIVAAISAILFDLVTVCLEDTHDQVLDGHDDDDAGAPDNVHVHAGMLLAVSGE